MAEENRQKLLNLLGLSMRAGYLVSGEDNVITEMKKGKVKIVFVASDSSLKTIDNFKRKCYFYKVDVSFDYSSCELSSSIGKDRKIIGLKNANMYAEIKKYLEVNKWK